MMKETTADSKCKGKNTGYTRAYMVSNCHKKVARVILWLNLLQYALALDVTQVLVGSKELFSILPR